MRLAAALSILLTATPAMAAEYDCLIEPKQLLKLAAPVQGVISEVDVERGDHVRKGQVVARLESDVEEANAQIAATHAANETAIASGRARVEFLQRKMGRNAVLRNGNVVSFATADETAADEKVAEAQLREAEMNVAQARLEARRAMGLLKQREVVSPVDGLVTERAMGPGEFRNDQAHILTIAEMDPLRVETFLPIAIYGQIKVGDTAMVMPEQPVGGRYKATVTVVDHVFDAASGTVGVRLALPNPDVALPAGIHCRVGFVKN
jgi:RND family efflux transporter MFP subunit